MDAFPAFCVGIAGLLAFVILLRIFTGDWNPFHLAKGTDGTLSTSKFQFLLWTTVIVFSYLVVFAYHAKAKGFSAISLDPSLLIVMGISAATAVAAKGIAVSNANAAAAVTGAPPPPVVPPPPPTTPTSNAGLFQADNGATDLGKAQLMIWTFIAIGVFLTHLHHNLYANMRELPVIDQTLLGLMGLGSGAYLGKKIAGNGGS